MDAQKTYVLWLNRNTEEQAFSGLKLIDSWVACPEARLPHLPD
jgi:hypothetical protein